jgi:methionyl-tRNA formyltransferase
MKTIRNPKVALAGSVGSSRRTLAAILRHKLDLVGVLGLTPDKSANVSGYARMDDLINRTSVPYKEFDDINASKVIRVVQDWQPDILFVVGLSQLIRHELLSIPRLGCVGFHPTKLPEGRGRAPIAWLILENRPGAATFFLMNEGVDAGPIFVQESFEVTMEDYAADVIIKLELAIDRALDIWLPSLIAGKWDPIPQDETKATYYGKRSPEDGLIDWGQSAEEICTLIRAASHPHPGAYTYINGRKLIVWRASVEKKMPYQGVIGRLLKHVNQKGWLIQTGDGLLWLSDIDFSNQEKIIPTLKVGMKLGTGNR